MSSLHVGTIAFDCYPDHPRLRLLCEIAADAGYTVDIICPRNQRNDKSYEVYQGVHIYRLPILRRGRDRSFRRTIVSWCLFSLLAAITVTRIHLKHAYDVIHVHNLPDFLVFTTLIPKLLGAKIILDVQDISPELMAVKSKRSWRRIAFFLAAVQERASTLFVDHVVTVGAPFGEALLKRGVSKDKMTILPNIVDPRIFPPSRRSAPLESPQEDPPFIVMYHGTVEERFGLDTAIHALALARRKVPQVRLDIQGAGGQLDFIKNLAVELGVNDSVKFTPTCPIEGVVDFVAHGDVGIIPYRCDGFADLALPTKAFEFAWMHRPMIASDMRGMRAVFRSESIAFCDSTDPESFANAIIYLYQHPEERATMIANAAEDYLPYHWEIIAERYRELLASIATKVSTMKEKVGMTSRHELSSSSSTTSPSSRV